MLSGLDRWTIQTSEIGGLDFLEMREGQTIFRFIPTNGGSQVDVSINGGKEWRYSATPARNMREAEAFGRAVAYGWRAQNVKKRARKPYKQTARAAIGQALGRARDRAQKSHAARAAGGEGGGHGIGLRDWRDPPPPGFVFDHPKAIALARIDLENYRASVEGDRGYEDLFAVAVALVRGYGLLPDAAGATLLAEYNQRSEPPWRDRDLRRALVIAESHGRMPWGVLYFRDLRLNRGGVRGGYGGAS